MIEEYNLTLGEAMHAMINMGEMVNREKFDTVVYYDKNNFRFKCKPSIIDEVTGGNYDSWPPNSKWRIVREPAKLITWHRPKVVWTQNSKRPLHWSGESFSKSKVKWLEINPGFTVLVWGSIEASETFEGLK